MIRRGCEHARAAARCGVARGHRQCDGIALTAGGATGQPQPLACYSGEPLNGAEITVPGELGMVRITEVRAVLEGAAKRAEGRRL